jgi:hypothetical protein
VCLFYTFIGLQAYRKSLKIRRFIWKIVYDYIQILILTLEGGLIFSLYGIFEYVFNIDNLSIILISLLIYSYNAFLVAFILEFLIWTDEKVKEEEAISGKKTNIRIFVLDTSMILIPLVLIPTLMISPFYLPLQSFSLWIFLVEFLILFSIFASIVYSLVKIIAPKSSKDSWARIKYQFEVLLATRGSMFNYPTPIDIFIGGELTEKVEHRWEKVTLKMACGQCYHVFTADTCKKGTNLKPIPCNFCGSSTTTPVWE